MSHRLVTRLLAEIDRRETAALAASPGPWTPNAEHDEVLAADGITAFEGFALSGNQLRATVDHVALHDPATVLRMCQAHRKLVSLCQREMIDVSPPGQDPDNPVLVPGRRRPWALPVLSALAEGYDLTEEPS